eukprot:1161398-Pelagomonas_calceolata.AAC.1
MVADGNPAAPDRGEQHNPASERRFKGNSCSATRAAWRDAAAGMRYNHTACFTRSSFLSLW